MKKMRYSAPDMEIISLTLQNVLGVSTNPPPEAEIPTSGGNEGKDGELFD